MSSTSGFGFSALLWLKPLNQLVYSFCFFIMSLSKQTHYEICELTHWPQVRKLAPNLVKNIAKFYLYFKGKCLLLVTQEGRVFTAGQNNFGQLGLGHLNSVTEPQEVSLLNWKNIISVVCLNGEVRALTSGGELYAWGSLLDRLYPDSHEENAKPKRVLTNIISMVCGESHTMALNKNGQVYIWGFNDFGQLGAGHREEIFEPTPIRSLGKVKEIFCFNNASMIRTASKMYVWGIFGELEIYRPYEVIIPENIKVKGIAPLENDFLLLATSGKVYHCFYDIDWEKIRAGEADEDELDINGPIMSVKLQCNPGPEFEEPVKSIFSSKFSYYKTDLVLFTTKSGIIICNWLRGLQFRTSLTSYAEIYSLYTILPVTPFMINFSPSGSRETQASHESFNNPQQSDFQFNVKHDKRTIYVQRSVLREKLPYFAQKLDTEWAHLTEVKIKYSYVAFYTLIRYLYTGELSFYEPYVLEIHQVAVEHMHSELVNRCLAYISQNAPTAQDVLKLYLDYPFYSPVHDFSDLAKSNINADNFVVWLEWAEKRKDESVVRAVAHFIHHNIALLQTDESYRKLDKDKWMKLIQLAANVGLPPLENN